MAASLTIEDLNKYSEVLSEHVEDINEYSTMVETGTSWGGTIQSINQYFQKIWTVEIAPNLYEMAQRITAPLEHVTHVQGDSLVEVPNYLKTLTKEDKVFFWLDAHYSGGDTSKNHLDCPVIEECVLIDKDYVADSAVIAIDDYRLFETVEHGDWSFVNDDAVKNSFENFNIVHMSEVDDRLLLYIERKEGE